MLWAVLGLLAAFLCGSIPFGYLIVRWRTGKDVREHGSGNIGSTNAARVLGGRWGYVVLVLDVLKGTIGVLVGALVMDPAQSGLVVMASLLPAAAIAGHCFTPWLGFRGGKGVATMFGALLPVLHGAVIVPVLVYLVIARVFKAVSAGSIAAALSVLLSTAFYGPLFAWVSVPVAALVLWQHRDNIKRLLAGTERRIGES